MNLTLTLVPVALLAAIGCWYIVRCIGRFIDRYMFVRDQRWRRLDRAPHHTCRRLR